MLPVLVRQAKTKERDSFSGGRQGGGKLDLDLHSQHQHQNQLSMLTFIHTYILHAIDFKSHFFVGFHCLVILSAGSDAKRTNLSQQSSTHASISRQEGAQDWKGGEDNARTN